jgi:hypothetical protein
VLGITSWIGANTGSGLDDFFHDRGDRLVMSG